MSTITPATTEANSLFGFSVANAGDVDGDGRPDILVGQPFLTGGGATNRGRVVVYSGQSAVLNTTTATALFTFDGTSTTALLGRAVAGVGDINGDGIADIIFGEPMAAGGGENRGRAFVWVAP
jgi:hypothetical protein